MLTEEQIKNLKPGDPLIIQGTYVKQHTDGDIVIRCNMTRRGFLSTDNKYLHPRCVSLPSDSQSTATAQLLRSRDGSTVNSQSKYDPCRPFKEGDLAQVVERNGRTLTCFPAGRIKVGDIVTVAEDEAGDVFIKVLTEDGHEMMVPRFMLELITPAEELGPYYIESETFDYEIRNANGDPDIGTSLAFHIKFQDPDEGEILSVKSYYESYVYSREHAEADAKAECKRLNEEDRKNQNNE